MQTQIRSYCTSWVTAIYTCSSVTSSILTTMNGSWLKITRIYVCKCQYLCVTFANILICIKMVEKHKTKKNQQTFYKCNMCNNTIKITLYCIPTRKATKGIKNIINAVDGQRAIYQLWKTNLRTDQFQKYICHAQIKKRDNEFRDVTLASVYGQKFKAHKDILSASCIFFKKL